MSRTAPASLLLIAFCMAALPASAGDPDALAQASHEALNEDPVRALLLAREGFRQRPDAATRTALYNALARTYEQGLLRGHGGPLTSVDLSATRVATGSEDGTARLWTHAGEAVGTYTVGRPVRDVVFLGDVLLTISDAETPGRVDARLWSGGEGRVLAEGIAPEAIIASPIHESVAIEKEAGTWLVTGAYELEIAGHGLVFDPHRARCAVLRDGKVALVDLATGAEIVPKTVTGANSVVFDLDGGRILVHGDGKTSWLLDEEGALVGPLKHAAPVECAVFTPKDGSLYVAAGDAIEHWSRDGRKEEREIAKQGACHALVFSQSGGSLLTALGKSRLGMVDIYNAEIFAEADLGKPVQSVALSKKSTWVKAHLEDGTWRFFNADLTPRSALGSEHEVIFSSLDPWGRWDVNADAQGRACLVNFVSRAPVWLRGHTNAVVDVASTKDGLLATASKDGTGRLWRIEQEGTPRLGGHQHHVYGGAFLWDRDRVVTMAWSDTFVWDLAGNPIAHEVHPKLPAWWAFCPRAFAVALRERDSFHVYDADGKQADYLDHGAQVAGVAWLPDGERLLSWSEEWRNVRIYDAKGALLGIVRQDDPIKVAIFLSRDLVATLGPADTVRVTTVAGEEKATWTLPEPAVTLTRSGDGRHVFTIAKDGTWARLFDATGKEVVALGGPDTDFNSVDLAPGSEVLLLTGGEDGKASLWREDGSLVAQIDHPAAVKSVSFFPDNKRFATACADGALRIFERDGSLWAILHGHTGPLTGFHFSRHGDQVLTLSEDFTARIWPATDALLSKVADARAHRDFTPDERAWHKDLLER